MQGNSQNIEKIILKRFMRMNATMSGLTVGTFLGLAIFLITNYLLIKGGPVVGPHLSLLGQFFWGYTVSFPGSLIGLAYGLVSGFIMGYCTARIYNWLVEFRDVKRHDTA